jgi:hypothetical protein
MHSLWQCPHIQDKAEIEDIRGEIRYSREVYTCRKCGMMDYLTNMTPRGYVSPCRNRYRVRVSPARTRKSEAIPVCYPHVSFQPFSILLALQAITLTLLDYFYIITSSTIYCCASHRAAQKDGILVGRARIGPARICPACYQYR